jgi:hypothetical protein
MWWPGTELNRRRQPFQGCALPLSYLATFSKPAFGSQAARIVHFTLIEAGLRTAGYNDNAGRVWNVLDYSNRAGIPQRPQLKQKRGPESTKPRPLILLPTLTFRQRCRAVPAMTPIAALAVLLGRRSC